LVTDKQVRRLFALIKTEQNQEMAASKAGMDAKPARKYRRHGGLPSELPTAVRGRTRPEPISAAGIEAMLVAEQNISIRDVELAVVDLRIFDQLFSAQEVLQ
jgi:hypothetical protein